MSESTGAGAGVGETPPRPKVSEREIEEIPRRGSNRRKVLSKNPTNKERRNSSKESNSGDVFVSPRGKLKDKSSSVSSNNTPKLHNTPPGESSDFFSNQPVPPITINNMISRHKFPDVIELNVGGTHFTTSLATLQKYPNSLLGKMFNGTEPQINRDSSGRYFIDRDPSNFGVILDFLRTDKVTVPPNASMPALLEECYFYNIEGFDLSITVNSNIAEQFRHTSYKVLRQGFDKLWPVLQKRIKMILETEPTYSSEIEWAHKGGVHNSLHRVEIARDADWTPTKSYIKVEISWKEETGVMKASACVETWARYLHEYGFKTQVVDGFKLRFFW